MNHNMDGALKVPLVDSSEDFEQYLLIWRENSNVLRRLWFIFLEKKWSFFGKNYIPVDPKGVELAEAAAAAAPMATADKSGKYDGFLL